MTGHVALKNSTHSERFSSRYHSTKYVHFLAILHSTRIDFVHKPVSKTTHFISAFAIHIALGFKCLKSGFGGFEDMRIEASSRAHEVTKKAKNFFMQSSQLKHVLQNQILILHFWNEHFAIKL